MASLPPPPGRPPLPTPPTCAAPTPPKQQSSSLALLSAKYTKQEAQAKKFSDNLEALKSVVAVWSGRDMVHDLKEPLRAAEFFLSAISSHWDSEEKKLAIRVSPSEEVSSIQARLNELKLSFHKRASQIEKKLKGMCMFEGEATIRDVTMESNICLGWWELKAAVCQRSMQLAALSGFMGSLIELKEEMTQEMKRAEAAMNCPLHISWVISSFISTRLPKRPLNVVSCILLWQTAAFNSHQPKQILDSMVTSLIVSSPAHTL